MNHGIKKNSVFAGVICVCFRCQGGLWGGLRHPRPQNPRLLPRHYSEIHAGKGKGGVEETWLFLSGRDLFSCLFLAKFRICNTPCICVPLGLLGSTPQFLLHLQRLWRRIPTPQTVAPRA